MIFSFITIDAGRLIFKHTKRPRYNRDTQRWDAEPGGLAVSAGMLGPDVEFDPTVLHPSGFWKHAPKWANYYGIDSDGGAYWFEFAPKIYPGHGWLNEGEDAPIQFSRWLEPQEPQLYCRTWGRVK